MPAETSAPIAIAGVRVWRGTVGGRPEDAVIRITEARIESVGNHPDSTRNARIHQFENAFAIPGLIDCHVHMTLDPTAGVEAQALISPDVRRTAMRDRALAMVRCGITTARDLGGGDWAELTLRDEIARQEAPGPRLLCAGQPLTSPRGHCHFWGGEAHTPDQVRQVIERQLAHGVDWIKVMATGGVATKGSSPGSAQFSADTLASVVALAQRAGREVAAHCHGSLGIAHAVRGGVRTVEHCSFAGEAGFGADFDPQLVREIAASSAWVSPTVNGGWARRIEHEGSPTRFFERMSRVLRALVLAGVPLVASTDAGIPGVHHHRLVEGLLAFARYADLDAEALLRSATVEAARALGLEAETGRIEPGLAADIVILPGDPLVDPEVLLRPLAVFARGRPFEPMPFDER